MPVSDARTQNGDRAFSYMVIENIFISGLRKSDPYYIITVLLRNIGYYRVTKFVFKINEAVTILRSINCRTNRSLLHRPRRL